MEVSSEQASCETARKAAHGEPLIVNACGYGYAFIGKGTAAIGGKEVPSVERVTVKSGTRLMVLEVVEETSGMHQIIRPGMAVEYIERRNLKYFRAACGSSIPLKDTVGWDFTIYDPALPHPEDQRADLSQASLGLIVESVAR